MIKVLIWNEFRQKEKKVADIYPEGIHKKLAEGFKSQADFQKYLSGLWEQLVILIGEKRVKKNVFG